jgi:hypothetical protein
MDVMNVKSTVALAATCAAIGAPATAAAAIYNIPTANGGAAGGTAASVKASLSHLNSQALAKSHAFFSTGYGSGAGKLTVTLTAGGKSFGGASASFTKTGSTRLKITLSGTGLSTVKSAAKKHASTTVSISVTFKPKKGSAQSAHASATIS